ncbi:hypothetical protein JT05_05685 [Desulfosporosinus sp. Tol-M]|nr:hypothetical protein JT05_05685 [Desulfosporosinus sp. Tol-M]
MSNSGWREVKLGEVCSKIGSGSTPTGGANAYCDSGIALIRSQNILDFKFSDVGLTYTNKIQAKKLNNVTIEEGDVLLNITGDSVARCCIVPKDILPARVNQHVAIIRGLQENVDNRYILYYLQHNKTYLLSIAGIGGTRNALTKKMIENLYIKLPPINEQKAIAGTLSCLDDKIELNNRINKNLEEMAQAIFKSWFIDFEPFQNGEFEDSELGRIPKGWRIFSISEIFEINPSRRIPRGTIAPYLDMSNMPTTGHAPKKWIERVVGSGMKFINGDTLVARITPCLENGKTAYVDFLGNNQVGWGSTEYLVIRPRSPISTIFAYILARSDRFRDYAIKRMTGSSGRQRVPADNIGLFKIVLPPLESIIHKDFTVFVESLFKFMRVLTFESRKLVQIRDTLLPKLMSGEIRVPLEEVQ